MTSSPGGPRRQRPFASLSQAGQARRLRAVARAALAEYDLQTSGLRLLSNDWNGVFRVETADGPCVLRISRPVPGATRRSVASEVAFMRALAEGTSIAVPAVVPSRSGDLVTLAEADGVPEPRECVVFGWLGGPDLAAHTNTRTWAALGELMGTMHRFAAGWQVPRDFIASRYGSCIPYGEPLVVFEPGRADLHGLEGLLQEALAVTNERIASLLGEVRPLVVHGDLHQWNVKMRRGVLSPFDFEDLLWAPPILDVATSLYYVRNRDDYPELAGAFRDGYERQRPWVEREPGEVDRLMFARAIDLLNAVLLDEALEMPDMEAFVRRREGPARIALGQAAAVAIGPP